ncbi:MAG: SDR family oxidoreductase [Akkermansiaceae bacterium]|nr:SDR family oxidoreductase [Akkermansiaceae bacterium]MDB4467236.1 SDR family oxidoreductase [Akkermansiaceae bacterium]MDB4569591.1 SDR family oxidoreductase [Akkermansiaceae bacterium]
MNAPQTALITGANGGIGSTLARKLSSAGTKLVLAGRNTAALESLASELGAASITCDFTKPDEVAGCVQEALTHLGEIEAVAHCIGSILLKPAHLTSVEDWQSVMDTNLNSSFYLLQNLARPMMKSGGSIAFVTSVAAEKGLSNHEAIASAKAGLAGLTRSAAATYAKSGLRVNAVSPGLTDTPLAAPITGNEQARKFSEAMHPLGRIGTPAEVASALFFLLSPDNTWITGQTLCVDGGLSSLQTK